MSQLCDADLRDSPGVEMDVDGGHAVRPQEFKRYRLVEDIDTLDGSEETRL